MPSKPAEPLGEEVIDHDVDANEELVTAPSTVAELVAAQADEYGTYAAKEAIFIGGARAFNAGDAVPISHVERGVVHPDQVTTKEG